MSSNSMNLDVTLSYSHGVGELAPYFDALAAGRTMARKCTSCSQVWFPPHAACPDDGSNCEWVELEGHGVIISATETRVRLPFTDDVRDVVFVLVSMAGADNTVLGRLDFDRADGAVGATVQLIRSEKPIGHPAQAVLFEIMRKT
jgi:uncharacterized protein